MRMRAGAGHAVLGLLLLLCAAFCLTELSEVDLHWHLLTGSRILDEGRVPRADDLSYVSAGRPWIDLQWLFELSLALVYRLAGWPGLDLLKCVLVTGAFTLSIVAALRNGAGPPAVGLVTLLGLVASQERFTLRPEAATFLMLGALLLLLAGRRQRPQRLLLVPLLFALWANLHALFAVGIGALGAVVAGDWVGWRLAARRGEAGLPQAPSRTLMVALGAAILATLVTPYGPRGWLLPWRLLGERIAADNVYARSIAEFQAPFSGFGFTASVLAFGLLTVLLLAALVAARGYGAPADRILLGVFFALALLARRNIPLFALVALPAGAPLVDAALMRAVRRLQALWPAHARLAASGPLILSAGVAASALILIAGVVTNQFYASDATQRYFGRGEAPGFYPRGAADFILAASPPGEVLNDMTMGGFLAWRWFPHRRVFIDGRLEVHDQEHFTTYLGLQQDPRLFEETARRYGVNAVLWSHRESAYAGPLLRYLASGHGWRPVFIDLAAAVFVRDVVASGTGAALPTLDPDDPRLLGRILAEAREAALRSGEDDPVPRTLRRLLPRREIPVAQVSAGLFFASIGSAAPAERLFREALLRSPGNPVLHYDLGLVLDQAGRREEARRSYDEALDRDPSFAPARAALARLLARTGEPEAALEQWRLAERSGPLGPASLEDRGELLARRGRLDEAIEDFRLLVRQMPGRSEARSALALLYLRNGQRQEALQEVRQALALDPRGTGSRTALARLRASEGDTAAAERIYREIVADDSSCAEAHLGLAALLATTGRPDEAVEEARHALAAGLDPGILSAEPGLRMLGDREEFRGLFVPPGSRPQKGKE